MTDPFGIQIRIHEAETLDAKIINIWRNDAQGGTLHLEPNEGWVRYKLGTKWKEPTLAIHGPDVAQVLQQLAEQLKALGIVPKETREKVSDLKQTLDAKDEHITDLRKVLDAWVSGNRN